MGQLKFGTSAFHAYVHQWSCQLQYNPRLNPGWGMSDGEGMEQIWSYLSPLISPLRYSTKYHHLSALNFRSHHHNDLGKANSGDFESVCNLEMDLNLCSCFIVNKIYERGKKIHKLLTDSQKEMQELQQQNAGHTVEYYQSQWERQKQCQLEVMNSGSEMQLRAKVEGLLELEEKLAEAR